MIPALDAVLGNRTAAVVLLFIENYGLSELSPSRSSFTPMIYVEGTRTSRRPGRLSLWNTARQYCL